MPRRRLVLLTAMSAILATACGVADADTDRAKILAATCLSTIARNGLPPPTPEQIAPERFVAERERMLATGRRFNTVTPYRNVCNAIRKEINATTTTTPTGSEDSDG